MFHPLFVLTDLSGSVLISILRNNAYFNMNIVEIPIIGLLWTLWFALSILSAEWASLWYPEGCPSRANGASLYWVLFLLPDVSSVSYYQNVLFGTPGDTGRRVHYMDILCVS